MKNELILLSGADIPFIEGTLVIHQPTIYEISYIGEQVFFTGCELLKFSKETLEEGQDKIDLSNYSDFYILMSIMSDKSKSLQYNISCSELVLDLLFPNLVREWEPFLIQLIFKDKDTGLKVGYIGEDNYNIFRDILISMICLEDETKNAYNAQSELAKKIAEKFQKRKQKLASLSPKTNSSIIFSKYVSILAVGEGKDINTLMKYTIYQLFDEFKRFGLKMAYDANISARMAGASGLEQPEDWMKNIHE